MEKKNKKQRYPFANKGPSSQSYGFSSSHVWMWELDHKEGWVPKNWCFCTVVLEKTLESPSDCKEIKPINPKENQPWIYMGKTGAEMLVLWPPDGKNQLIGKYPNAGQDWRQEEKGTTEDEMVGWHHWLNGHEFEQALEDGEGSKACCAVVHGVSKIQTWPSDWITAVTRLIITKLITKLLLNCVYVSTYWSTSFFFKYSVIYLAALSLSCTHRIFTVSYEIF